MREPWQFMVLFLVTIGGIYAGIFSPTEAAAVGAFGAILLGVARPPADAARRCCSAIESTVVSLRHAVRHRVRRQLFSFFMVQTQLPDLLADGAHALNLSGLGGHDR